MMSGFIICTPYQLVSGLLNQPGCSYQKYSGSGKVLKTHGIS
jgi:hypothetical protein